ncbi:MULTISPECIES: S41 family peptidase [unclassified Sphingomonas]|jgi:tricorn protease|uniref:S41 family peptidase n=1 Tax=unclassified Sphingomonas TaxID=196159 RepID=UPI00053D3780|nr:MULTISPECIES: S41 family peptidase [unclassified Sphingomonas]
MIFRGLALATATLLASTTLASLPATAQAVAAKAAFAEPSLSPDGSLIAFASGGDIWEVAATGGTARPLVTDAATEGRPLYSPDGTRLAFTSTRGGSQNLYVLDLASGAVTRLTYAESAEELDAWSPDGKYLYFASGVADVGRQADIYRVPASGGTPMQVSREKYLAEFQAAPSPDGTTLAINARGLSGSQWWRNGTSHIDETELWLKPVAEGGAYRRLLPGGEKHAWPMWSRDGQSIVYMSARGGTENLWRVGLGEGAAPEQLTHFADGRLLYPSMAANGSAIVFERDFGVWRYDPATSQTSAVPITLRGAASATPRRHEQLQSFSRLAVSGDGQKVAVIGHGEVFAAPAKDGGPAQRITNTPGAEREVVWSPDSRRALVISERGLDHALVEYDVASGRETMLTTRGIASVPSYAPDGKSVAYVLNDRELHLVTLGTGGTDRTLFTGAIATDGREGPRPTWSPDGQYVAFPLRDARSFVNVHVVPAAGGAARPVSFLGNGEMGGIAWSPDGKYILFDTAQRSEDSRIVRVDLLPHVPKFREDKFSDLFKPGKQPGTPDAPADSPAPARPKPLPVAAKKGAALPLAPKAPPVAIVWQGLRGRATILPLGLSADTPVISTDGKTLVFRASEKGRANLYSYTLDELADEPPVAQQLTQSDRPKGDFALSGDGKTLFYLDGGRVISTPIDSPKPKPINIAADMDIDFASEKQVVFDEAWSILNRKFFDAGFNGHDWTALRARFQPYVAGARTPDELRRIIGLMIGELNASHTGINRPFMGPGTLPSGRVGDLGLRFDRSAYEAGRGLVVREVVTLSPAATEKIVPGERIVSVGGVAVGAHDNLDALLENTVGRRVRLGVEGANGRREVVVRPVSAGSAAGLAYRQWVDDRRALVERLSGGKLGYVHIADMSSESLDQLYLDLDAENQGKQGVVVDIRNNNGGFINGYAIDVFARRNYLTMTPRDLFSLPGRQALGQRALGKPTVLVTNESSLSDAEDFTEGYRSLGLGKVVGQPTAGWIIFTGAEPLIDGSSVRTPSTRIQDGRGQDMEMHPRPVDLAVERPLGETATGEDAQLRAAVDVLLAQVGAGKP